MHNRIIFEKDGISCTIESHEIVWIAKKLIEEEMANPNTEAINYSPTSPDVLKSAIEDIYQKTTHSYASYYDTEPHLIESAIQTIRNHNDYYSGSISRKPVKLFLEKTEKKEPPSDPLLSYESFYEVAFPNHIKKMKTLQDWLKLAAYIRNKHQQTPVSGWWLSVGNRLICLRNKAKGENFLYASDHGSNQKILDATIQALLKVQIDENFYFTLKTIDNILKKASVTDIEKIKNLFLINYSQYKGKKQELGNLSILIEALIDYQDSLKKPDLLDELFNDPIIKKILESDSSEIVTDQFYLAHEEFLFLSRVIREFNLFSVSGKSAFPIYKFASTFMHQDDSSLFSTINIMRSITMTVNQGDRASVFRPLDAYGNRNKGATYTEFAQAIIDLQNSTGITDADIAKQMREIVTNNEITTNPISFLPNLAVVMFCSEVTRIPRLIISTIMLLDLIENQFKIDFAQPTYTWLNALVSPQRVKDNIVLKHGEVDTLEIPNSYGEMVNIKYFDGLLPSAHKDSASDQNFSNGHLSPTQQKEAMIILQWLYMMLLEPCRKSGIQIKTEHNATRPRITKNGDITHYCFDGVWSTQLSKKASAEKNIALKWEMLHHFILPHLRKRLSSTDNMKPTPTQTALSSSSHITFFKNDNSVDEEKSISAPSMTM